MRGSPEGELLRAILAGDSLGRAVRATGVTRRMAKRVIGRLGFTCVAFQHQVFGTLHVGELSYRRSWGFAAKQHVVSPAKLDCHGPQSVWTQLCVDDATGLVPLWLVGPDAAWAVRTLVTEVTSTWSGARLHVSPADTRRTGSGDPEDHANDLRLPGAWADKLEPGFARKVRHHACVVALFLMHHNFCRVGPVSGTTPAIEAGIVDRAWSVENILGLLLRAGLSV